MLTCYVSLACSAADARTVVIIVRHAEQETNGADPDLTEAGLARGSLLAAALSASRVSTVYTTQFKRTQRTAVSLAGQQHVSVVSIEANLDEPHFYVQSLTRDITTKHRGETVLVVTHSNVMSLLVEALTGKTIPAVSRSDFDRLFVAILGRHGEPIVIRAKY